MSEIQETRSNTLIENRETGATWAAVRNGSTHNTTKGKYTARERIQMLLDEGSLRRVRHVRHAPLLRLRHGRRDHTFGDGVVTGYGTIDGRLVYVFAQDFTVYGRFAVAVDRRTRSARCMDMAMHNGAPVHRPERFGRRPYPGGRERVWPAMPNIFQRNVMASGVIPQISAIFGPCAGGAVYSPALTDFIIMKQGQHLEHVPHRPEGRQDRDRRRRDAGAAGRRHRCTRPSAGVAQFAVRHRGGGHRNASRKLLALPAVRTTWRTLRWPSAPTAIDRLEDVAQRDHPRQPQQALRHGRT